MCLDDVDVLRPERGQEEDVALALAYDHGHGRAVVRLGQELELAVGGGLLLPHAVTEGLGQEPEGLVDEGPEPFEGDMEQGPGIEHHAIAPDAVFDLKPVHGADDIRQPGLIAAADEADDTGAFADPLRERSVNFGMELGPAGRGLAADLIEDDVARAGQVERFVQTGRPACRPGLDVVLFGDEAVFIGGGEIDEQDLGHRPTPS